MSDGVWIALIVAVTSTSGPLLLAWLTNRARSEDKQEDWARQDAVAAQAAEAAALLLKANERVAAATDQTNQKLDVIHTLVNSNLTAAMLAELSATEAGLVLMREMVDDRLQRGVQPSPEATARIRNTETRINELRAQVTDRQTQTELAESQLQEAKSSAAGH
jgi:hypothetical protein